MTEWFRCPVCAGESVQIEEDQWTCRACNGRYPVDGSLPLLFKDWGVHRQNLDQAQVEKPEWYVAPHDEEKTSPWRHHLKKRRIYVQSVLQQYIGINNRAPNMLDLACGDGQNFHFLAPFTSQLYGCDYNPIRLKRAVKTREGSKAILFCADILNLPVLDNFFGIVFFNHGLEHFSDDVDALKSVYRVLRSGGLLILGTPNEGALWWRLAYTLDPGARRETDHVQFYTADSLTMKMRSAGFKVSHVEHMGWGPPNWKLDWRVRRYKAVDDILEKVGRILFRKQASSLYVIASKDIDN